MPNGAVKLPASYKLEHVNTLTLTVKHSSRLQIKYVARLYHVIQFLFVSVTKDLIKGDFTAMPLPFCPTYNWSGSFCNV